MVDASRIICKLDLGNESVYGHIDRGTSAAHFPNLLHIHESFLIFDSGLDSIEACAGATQSDLADIHAMVPSFLQVEKVGLKGGLIVCAPLNLRHLETRVLLQSYGLVLCELRDYSDLGVVDCAYEVRPLTCGKLRK